MWREKQQSKRNEQPRRAGRVHTAAEVAPVVEETQQTPCTVRAVPPLPAMQQVPLAKVLNTQSVLLAVAELARVQTMRTMTRNDSGGLAFAPLDLRLLGREPRAVVSVQSLQQQLRQQETTSTMCCPRDEPCFLFFTKAGLRLGTHAAHQAC